MLLPQRTPTQENSQENLDITGIVANRRWFSDHSVYSTWPKVCGQRFTCISGCFPWLGLGPLVPIKGLKSINTTTYSVLPTLCQYFVFVHFLFGMEDFD